MSEKKETFTEQTLRRIHSEQLSPPRKKKRNISRLIMIADALIIVIVLIFLNARNSKDDQYNTASINGSGLNVRFSVNNEKNSNDYMFTLTIISSMDDEKTWNFDPCLAALKLRRGGDTFYEGKFGAKISKITILPGEARTFPLQISYKTIDASLREKAGITERKKTLFDLLVKSNETIQAEAVLNLQERISASINFQHEAGK